MSSGTKHYLLSMGTNLGEKLANLRNAISELAFMSSLQVSSPYETKALLPSNAKPEWDLPFINIVISGYSNIGPQEMLGHLKELEKKLGRDIKAPRWSPRIIDIYILLVDDLVVDDDVLTVPHPEMLKRGFVLLPAAEIVGHVKHPISKKTLHKHLSELSPEILDTIKKINAKL